MKWAATDEERLLFAVLEDERYEAEFDDELGLWNVYHVHKDDALWLGETFTLKGANELAQEHFDSNEA